MNQDTNKEQKEQRFRNWKNTRFTSVAWVLAILIMVIAIMLNMIVARLDFSWDISPNHKYSLSSTTESYLDELDQQGTTVDFYLLAEMDDLKTDTETLTLYRALLAYDEHDCINLIDFNPDTDDAMMEKINSDNAYTLSTGDMVFMCNDISKRVPGSSMYTVYTDDEGNTTSEDFTGENLITGTIKGIVDNFTPTVYFLSGHGEKALDQYSSFTSNLKNYNYDVKELNLTQEDAVPDDAALVLVAGPTADITDAETDKINAYLDNGGNISLLMSPNGGSFAYENLDQIMEDYGFYMDYDTVSETNSAYHISGDNTTIQCQLNELDEDSEAADLTSSLIDQGLYTFMPKSRSFNYYDEGGKYTIAPLITTYDSAVGEPYGGISDDPEEINGELLLSAYSVNNERNESKMVVFGNAEFIDDTHVSDETVIVPVYLFLSTISWMYDSDVDMEIANKTSSTDYISLQDENFARGMIIALTIIPVVIMGLGIGIWIKRRNS